MTTLTALLDYKYCVNLGICLFHTGHVLLNNYHLKIISLVLSMLSIILCCFSIKSPPPPLTNIFRLIYICLTCLSGVKFYSIFNQSNDIKNLNIYIILQTIIIESISLLMIVFVELTNAYLNLEYNIILESSELERQLQEEEEKKEALTAVWKASVKLEKAKEELEKHRASSSTVRSRSCLNQDQKTSELESLIKQLEIKLQNKRQEYSNLLRIPLIPPPYPTTELTVEDVIAVVAAK